VRVAVNLAAEPQRIATGAAVLEVLLASEPPAQVWDAEVELPPESVAIVLCETPAPPV
jgi:hypothetical protein